MRLIVVCTGNICRSPMAEGFLADRLRAGGFGAWSVASRGLYAVVGQPATAESVLAAAERGIDIRQHRGRQLTPAEALAADLILTLETWHRTEIREMVSSAPEKVQLLTHYENERADRDIADPYGRPYRFYTRCRDEIEQAVAAFLQHLMQGAGGFAQS